MANVYVFDDSGGWREIFRKIVQAAGLHFQEFKPRAGAGWIPSKKELDRIYDDAELFIVDVRLPDELEGLQLLLRIRSLEKERGITIGKRVLLVSVLEAYRIQLALKDIQLEDFFHKSRLTELEKELTVWARHHQEKQR